MKKLNKFNIVFHEPQSSHEQDLILKILSETEARIILRRVQESGFSQKDKELLINRICANKQVGIN